MGRHEPSRPIVRAAVKTDAQLAAECATVDERQRINRRRQKLKARYAGNYDAAISDAFEKLSLLIEIRAGLPVGPLKRRHRKF